VVCGFDQAEALRLEPRPDATDLVLLRWLMDFAHTGKMETLRRDGRTFYWVKHAYVLDCLPILGITTSRGLRNRLQKLCAAGVLVHHEVRHKRGTRAFYGFGDAYEALTHRNEISGGRGNVSSGSHRNESSGQIGTLGIGKSEDSPPAPQADRKDTGGDLPKGVVLPEGVLSFYEDLRNGQRQQFDEKVRRALERCGSVEDVNRALGKLADRIATDGYCHDLLKLAPGYLKAAGAKSQAQQAVAHALSGDDGDAEGRSAWDIL
jgi:hypothetical protein